MTKRQVLLKYGFNQRAFRTLVDAGLINVAITGGKRVSVEVDEQSVLALKEGPHYVVCRMCKRYVAQITPRHLMMCSGMCLATYCDMFPDAALMSGLCAERKKKTIGQKQAQSAKLKARFQTEAGEQTRQQISDAARRLQASPYGVQAAAHLRALTRSPEGRLRASLTSIANWQNAAYCEKMASWRESNRTFLRESAARARQFITHKSTKPHRALKAALEVVHLSFETEYQVGYYAIDEANPDLMVAVEVDGCYWHGCKACGFEPFGQNACLDKRKNTYLRRRGWEVVRISECRINGDINSAVAIVQAVVEARAWILKQERD